MLLNDTTRREYLVHLAKTYARSAVHGGNRAVLQHLVKIQDLSEEDWPAHRTELISRESERAAAARVMAEALKQTDPDAYHTMREMLGLEP